MWGGSGVEGGVGGSGFDSSLPLVTLSDVGEIVEASPGGGPCQADCGISGSPLLAAAAEDHD